MRWGEPFALNDQYRVWPDYATNKTIIWTVKDPGPTGAVITNNIFTAAEMGDATITGTVANGRGPGIPFTVDRTARVKGPLVPHGDFVVRDVPGGVELVTYIGNDAHVVIPDDLGITVVWMWSLAANTITSVVVPEGVTESDDAFGETWYLTTVTLPASLRIIRTGFHNSHNLSSLTVKAVEPPSVIVDGKHLFLPPELTPENLTIYVPVESVNAYKNADGWKEYADFITAIP